MIIIQYLPGSERRAAPAVTMSCFIPLIVLLGLAACEESSGVPDGGDAGLMTDVGGSPPPDAATDTSMQDAAGLDVATSDAGTRPPHCAATCSDHGRCVRIDGEPTCACDSGYYPRGLSCLRRDLLLRRFVRRKRQQRGHTCRTVEESRSGTDRDRFANPGRLPALSSRRNLDWLGCVQHSQYRRRARLPDHHRRVR
jgi:hypothetical protein